MKYSTHVLEKVRSVVVLTCLMLALSHIGLPPEVAEASSGWSEAGSMATARAGHSTTLLPSGKVLIVGGENGGSVVLSTAELYDPTTNSWDTAGSLTSAREGHSATLLPSGKVLVTGGRSNGGYLSTAELYDPATNIWSTASSMISARDQHSATLLLNGKVLVAGGANNGGNLSSGELYDPTTDIWSTASSLATARREHSATLLPSGKVLVVGGYSSNGYLSSTELYDPTTNSWSTASPLVIARWRHSATLLPSGKVLVVGGFSINGHLSSTELYDPTTNSWSTAGSLQAARREHSATLLPSGEVLVVGGKDDSEYLSRTDLYDPVTNCWLGAGSLASARTQHSTTLLPSGKVLVIGGRNSSGYLSTYELYDMAIDSWSTVSVTPSSYNFGTVATNESSVAIFSINNSGNQDLAVSAIDTTGGDSTMFSITPFTCVSLTPTIAAGASCSVSVVFSPTSAGSKATTLLVISNVPVSSITNVALSGMATQQSSPRADLSVTHAAPATLILGSNLIYTLTINNSGHDAASGVTVSGALPVGVKYVSVLPSQGSCSVSGSNIICPLGTLASGASATVALTVLPTSEGTITNSVTGTAAEADPNPSNNSSTATTVVTLGQPRISGVIALKGIQSQTPTQKIVYLDVRLTNTGTGHARNLKITSLPVRTLAGAGTVSYNATLSPPLPITVGDLNVGEAKTTRLYFNVPKTVTRFSVTESGSLQNVLGNSFSFSTVQSVMP